MMLTGKRQWIKKLIHSCVQNKSSLSKKVSKIKILETASTSKHEYALTILYIIFQIKPQRHFFSSIFLDIIPQFTVYFTESKIKKENIVKKKYQWGVQLVRSFIL